MIEERRNANPFEIRVNLIPKCLRHHIFVLTKLWS